MTTPPVRRASSSSVTVDAVDLRQEMERRGLTGSELARRARVSPATVSHALNGRRLHPAKRRAIYAALHGVEPIAGGDQDPIAAERRLAEQRNGRGASRSRSGYVSADPSRFDRLARGFSYREIAREAGMSPTTVARVAAGLPVRPSILRRAAAALSRLQADPAVAALLGPDPGRQPADQDSALIAESAMSESSR